MREYIFNFSTKIYSQEGEDIILNELLQNKSNGFYVDIGAHHPRRFSNTHLFYKKGWRGINIDAMPGSMKVFKRERPRDINLELGVSGRKGNMVYYMFDEPALNGFSGELSKERDKESNFKIIGKKKINTYPLSTILDRYLPKGEKIDFISIDVEGLDLVVLKSNNWKKYSPKYVLIEYLNIDIESIMKDPLYSFLSKKGYKIVAKTFRTLIFEKTK